MNEDQKELQENTEALQGDMNGAQEAQQAANEGQSVNPDAPQAEKENRSEPQATGENQTADQGENQSEPQTAPQAAGENQNRQETANEGQETPQDTANEEHEPEVIPSMDEFKDELTRSFRKLKPGDIVKGTVIGISETEVTLDLGSYAEGIIKLEELSNDPRFSIKADVAIGEEMSATVLREDKEGNILLSRKQADDVLAWDTLKQMLADKTAVTVKVAQEVKGGVVTYLQGIRAFIPASKLDVNYVEDLSTFVGKELQVQVITADEENNKLVLSAKDLAIEKALQEKNNRAASLPIGTITTGKVEKIMPFGAFIQLGDGLSGLVHISQMSQKRIKTPNEVVKLGDEVKVKILGVKDGKISLSMKALDENAKPEKEIEELPTEYSSGGEAVTGLAALLKNIKLSE